MRQNPHILFVYSGCCQVVFTQPSLLIPKGPGEKTQFGRTCRMELGESFDSRMFVYTPLPFLATSKAFSALPLLEPLPNGSLNGNHIQIAADEGENHLAPAVSFSESQR